MRPLFLIVSMVSLILRQAHAQDTVFVQKHWFETPVRNVFLKEEKPFVKTGDGLYSLEKGNWKKLDLDFEKPFVFYENGFFETEFIPDQHAYDANHMARLIPQKSLISATKANLNDRLFVAAGGSLFEYEIKRHYELLYQNTSIRNVFLDEGISVISTYSGIFINDTLRKNFPPYSNGNFVQVEGQYYICTDELFKVISEDSVQFIRSGQNIFAGHSRKLLEWQGKIYSLNTNSINELQSDFNLFPIHKGFEYSDLEVFDSTLYFSTYDGILFSYDGENVSPVFKVDCRIREIFSGDDFLFLATDKGAFRLDRNQQQERFFEKPFCVDIEQDRFKNIWIATENGLFLVPKGRNTAVPLVSDVEFNRYAMTHYQDKIYAGSINGLYLFDIYTIERGFLPAYFQKVADEDSLFWRDFVVRTLGFGIPIVALLFFLARTYLRKSNISVTAKPEKYSLKVLEDDIVEFKLLSVDSLATHLHTNTVQLNRQFKSLGTTPGKFMKKVKISWAKKLLNEGKDLEEVAKIVGYSPRFLSAEFRIDR
jgi:AraC-like DNA-binding protein